MIAFVVALLTVSWQSWRAATRNPVEAIRNGRPNEEDTTINLYCDRGLESKMMNLMRYQSHNGQLK
jgi:hypothetical protein